MEKKRKKKERMTYTYVRKDGCLLMFIRRELRRRKRNKNHRKEKKEESMAYTYVCVEVSLDTK